MTISPLSANKSQMRNSPPARSSRKLVAVAALIVAISAIIGHFARNRPRPDGDPASEFKGAQAAYSAGRLDEADAILARLSRGRTPTIAERLLRAEIARQRGNLDLALAALDGFGGSDLDTALIWRTRGMLEIERDRARPAEAALRRALELNPALAIARRDLISLYTLQSRRSEIREQFRALAAITDLSFEELYLWCLGRRVDVGPADLASKLERMLRNDPDDRSTRLALAENLRRLGRLENAEQAVAPLAIDDAEVRAAHARLALDRGDVATARNLLAGGPTRHTALALLRGRLALADGDAGAVHHYRMALAGNPDDRDTLFGLAQALRLAGEAEAAKPYLQRARDRDQLDLLIENARSLSRRQDPTVLQAIGDRCRSLALFPEARGWYRLALARNPADPDLQKRLFELDASISIRSCCTEIVRPSTIYGQAHSAF
jgi:tetratricopeptide (TPR) repeat protein